MSLAGGDVTPSAVAALGALLENLGDAMVHDDQVSLRVRDAPEDERQATFVAYVGLVDLLAEAALAESPDGDRDGLLSRALSSVGAAEGPLRYARHERGTTAERRELVSRMRSKDIALTSEWLVPRLHRDIETYRRRIDALRRAIGERER